VRRELTAFAQSASCDAHRLGASTLTRFIGSSAWGRALSHAESLLVANSCREQRVDKDECLFSTNQPAEYWYGVIDGLLAQVVLAESGRVTHLATARRGIWFGEGTLLKREAWQYDCLALRPSHLVLIPRETFEALRGSSIAFNQYLQTLLNSRLAFYVGLLAADRTQDPEERVAKLIASFCLPELSSPRELTVPLKQEELGLMAGLSRQRVNLALRRLQDLQLIQLKRSGIRILDQDRLTKLSTVRSKMGMPW
jgi:CRP/FNR family cyclic AMP-dependent transcriptional regulator